MKQRIEMLIKLGLTETQAKDFCYSIGEEAFEAGRNSEKETIHSNIEQGIIGKDGFYFSEWFEKQINNYRFFLIIRKD